LGSEVKGKGKKRRSYTPPAVWWWKKLKLPQAAKKKKFCRRGTRGGKVKGAKRDRFLDTPNSIIWKEEGETRTSKENGGNNEMGKTAESGTRVVNGCATGTSTDS